MAPATAETMTTAEKTNIVINFAMALATFLAVIVAIWGDFFRRLVAAPKLSLVPQHKLRGCVVPLSDRRQCVFYHLNVVNKRKWVSATNCRVVLKRMWRKGPDNTSREITLAVPLTLIWSPAEAVPPYTTVRHEQTLDFVSVIDG